MQVYLAGRYSQKEDIKVKARELESLGIEVTSSWLEEPHSPQVGLTELTPDLARFYAHQDLTDIYRADLVILFTVDPNTPTVRGGRHFESGFAHGLGRPLILCGPRENVFHYLPSVKQYDTWAELLTAIEENTLVSTNR